MSVSLKPLEGGASAMVVAKDGDIKKMVEGGLKKKWRGLLIEDVTTRLILFHFIRAKTSAVQ